jgi:hypothetical protein
MKKLFDFRICILFFLVTYTSQAQLTFQKTYGNINGDYAYSANQTSDKGFIIAGYTSSYGAGQNDFYLAKTDSAGDLVWSKTYGGTRDDEAYSVQQTLDGGYIIAGYSKSFGVTNYNAYLIKTDANGDTAWTKTYGGINSDYANAVQQTIDGEFILAGYTNSFVTGSDSGNIYLIKTDVVGNIKWTTSLGGTIAISDGYSIKQTIDKGYILTGYTNSFSDPNGDAYLLKTDSNGILSWTKTYGSLGVDWGNSVQQTSDGGYIIAGSSSFDSTNLIDVYLIKTNTTGDTLWTKTYGGKGYDFGQYVEQTTDGGYIIGGYTNSFGAGSYDAYLIKTDASGNIAWTKTYGGTGDDEANSVHQTTDGAYILTGYTNSFGFGDYDVYLIKTDVDGNTCEQTNAPSLMYTASTFQSNQTMQTYTANTGFNYVHTLQDTGAIATAVCSQTGIKSILDKTYPSITIFPNPNQGIFVLSTNFTNEAKITIKNILGEIVYTSTINSSKEIDLSTLTNGTYFVQLQFSDKIYSQKIIITN